MKKIIIIFIIVLFFCSSIIFATQYGDDSKKKIPSSCCSNRSIIKGKDMVQHEGWIYYSNQEKGGIYRQSIDGLRLEKLNDAKSDYINIVGNSIYFRQVREHAVCKMSLDGSNKIILYEGVISDLMYLEDGLYFIEPTLEGSCLYRLDKEKKKIKIINENIENVMVLEDWIYYSVIGERSINRFSRKKLKKEVLYHGSDLFTVGINEIYFYEQERNNLCKMNLDGSKISIIKKSTPIRMLDVINKSIFYSDGKNIYCIQDGVRERTMLDVDCPIIDFSISNNGLLYSYVEKLDGKESVRQKLVLLDEGKVKNLY